MDTPETPYQPPRAGPHGFESTPVTLLVDHLAHNSRILPAVLTVSLETKYTAGPVGLQILTKAHSCVL